MHIQPFCIVYISLASLGPPLHCHVKTLSTSDGLRWSASIEHGANKPFHLCECCFLASTTGSALRWTNKPFHRWQGVLHGCVRHLQVHLYNIEVTQCSKTIHWRHFNCSLFCAPGVRQVGWCIEVSDGFTFYLSFIFWGSVSLHLYARACTIMLLVLHLIS